MMRTRILSILALLLMAATGAKAETITITWDSSKDSFDNRVSYSKLVSSGEEYKLAYGGTFTTTLGNFTKIELIDGYWERWGKTIPGWNNDAQTWTGNASSVLMNMELRDNDYKNPFQVKFTIEAKVDVTSITLDPATASMTLGGETLTLTPTVLPDNATDKSVTWTTSDASVATVDADGVVTAVAVGKATITATAKDGTGVTGTCTVNVTPPTYDVTLADGTEDAANWKAEPNPAEEGQTVTITYSGTKRIKSLKAVKKVALNLTNPTTGQVYGASSIAFCSSFFDILR